MRILVLISLYFCSVESCSDIAQYYSDYYGTYGLVKIPHVPLQQNIFVEVQLSVAAKLPGENSWKISLVNTNVYNDLLNDRDLKLKFIPIITNPLPIVTGVFLNGNQLCSSPPARGYFISTIKLQYTYTLNGAPVSYPTYNKPPIQSNPKAQLTNYDTNYLARSAPNPISAKPIQMIRTTQPIPIQPIQAITTTQRQIVDKIDDTTTENLNVCGVRRIKQSFSSFVIGGQAAMRNEFPWLAAFYYKENGFICGGTLLSPRIVVTAAHCVQDKSSIELRSAYDSSFYLGKYKLNDLNEKDYVNSGVDSFIVHPDWNPLDERYKGDLSIAVLSKTIIFSNFIIPLCVWPQTSGHTDLVNIRGIVAGWGITQNGTTSEVPMFVTLPVVDDIKCLRSNEIYSKITANSNFCAGDRSGRSPCNGDSGGAFAVQNPTDHKYYFRGIVSSGLKKDDRTCDNYNYAVFTDAAYYSDWIMSYIHTYR